MRFWGTVVIAGLLLAIGPAWGHAVADEPEPTPAAGEPGEEGTETTPVEPPANTLKWTTASEVDNFGFDIYRALVEDGPFDRITTEPLPGAGTTDEPQHYTFADTDIDPTRDYFYYIESISLGGVREKFSPVIRAPAKRPTEEKD
jgi:hypothetical protein